MAVTQNSRLTGIGTDLVRLTPSDTNDIPFEANIIGLRIGATAGDVVVTTAHGTDRTIAVAAGERLELAGIRRLKATGTSATPVEAYVAGAGS